MEKAAQRFDPTSTARGSGICEGIDKADLAYIHRSRVHEGRVGRLARAQKVLESRGSLHFLEFQ